MKIAVAQLNPTVGDLDGNIAKIMAAYNEAAEAGAELVIAPEMVLTGYPLEDLVLRQSFIQTTVAKVDELEQTIRTSGHTTTLIFGAPYTGQNGGVCNAAFLIDPTKEFKDWERDRMFWSADKWELPNYGVFDEKRVFQPSYLPPHALSWRGYQLGLMICEDAWFPRVAHELMNDDAAILISINGSPFEIGKNVTRRKVVAERIKETGLPFLYANLVGGQDEIVFDGGSFFYDGNTMQEAPHFKEGVFYFEADLPKGTRKFVTNEAGEREQIGVVRDDGTFSHWTRPPEPLVTLDHYPTVEPSSHEAIYQALVLGTRDYFVKQGFRSAVLGYSGGVDSGLVAAIACDALGPDKVSLVRLPSKFSSEGSLMDAYSGAARLGVKDLRTISIEPVVDSLRLAYKDTGWGDHEFGCEGWALTGVADENIQARARGVILMAISNQEGHLLLTTGNKSEVSVGYSTLYGDMSGGFNPVKDCYKTTVWELCRYRNSLTQVELDRLGYLGRATEVVPEAIIVKPPSAELRPDQKDEDSLPPYPVLDAILKGMIEDELSRDEIAAKLGLDLDLVSRIRLLVDRSEYKRRQAAPGVKITSKIHGRDRRYPIVNAWRG